MLVPLILSTPALLFLCRENITTFTRYKSRVLLPILTEITETFPGSAPPFDVKRLQTVSSQQQRIVQAPLIITTMASEKLFRDLPTFPDDVPVMPMSTISLANLRSGDIDTAQRVLDACQELGFFLLDLRGDQLGEIMMDEVDQLFDVGKNMMNMSDDIKQQYLHDIPRSFLGFKPRGSAKTETGGPDRFEWFNIGQDALMGNTPLQPLPDLVRGNLSLLKSFLNHGQDIVAMISSTLASQLSLPPDSFTSMQPPDKPSGTVIRVIKAFAFTEPEDDLQTSMIHHTDFGTITLLANVLGGLQVLAPGGSPSDESAWRWVRPQPGCLIVNLGDAMVQWTSGILRSNVHRIRYAPGQQRYVNRYSLALLVRPERNASMRSMVGGEAEDTEDSNLTAWEWEVKKLMALSREGPAAQSKGGKALAV
ncbi:Clavaminate synthase-like protein [Whalleya microplaca]|nr:Clavaminate synthase-like protein [Whalleya microplaca]